MYLADNVGRNTIAMVLAGGKGERLSPLTLRRAKPSVAFGGKYKIIDFVLSNLFNSGIKKVYILTQYRAYSLNKHIRESWGKWTGLGEFYVAISPETSSESEEWFKGTADAILQYLRFVESADADYVAVFGGDHIYKMDISQMIQSHRMNRADITIAALEVPVEEARRFGVFAVDDDARVTGFAEKPDKPETIPGRGTCFASMGNYIFPTRKLIEVLLEGKKQHEDLDFGKHVIPKMLADGDRVFLEDKPIIEPFTLIPFLAARFPRSYVDANREPYEHVKAPSGKPVILRVAQLALGDRIASIPQVAAVQADYRIGQPFQMWRGTPYAHIMIPVGGSEMQH